MKLILKIIINTYNCYNYLIHFDNQYSYYSYSFDDFDTYYSFYLNDHWSWDITLRCRVRILI